MIKMSDENVPEGVDALTLNEDQITPGDSENIDFVDPWNVTSTSESGIDYDKLISKCLYCLFFSSTYYIIV